MKNSSYDNLSEDGVDGRDVDRFEEAVPAVEKKAWRVKVMTNFNLILMNCILSQNRQRFD
jgi:hypothetical protein